MDVASAEMAATVLAPYFDAVRDVFSAYEPAAGERLVKLERTQFVVEESIHDSDRHFAGCRQDGMLILLAPESVELPEETLVAIIAHEFGHAADYAYPAKWLPERDAPAHWLGASASQEAKRWRKAWPKRSRDQQEWAADSIAQAVTGRKIGYCGPCLLQCWDGQPRPGGLR
jgi:hypothetical protein